MKFNPHLTFSGQCAEAFALYETCLKGKIAMMMKYGDAPGAERTNPEWRGKILHATFTLGDQTLTGADVPPDRYQQPQGFYVLLDLEDAAEADRIFETLADRGTVKMALQETFWASRFGVLVDRFGTPWEINCGKGQTA